MQLLSPGFVTTGWTGALNFAHLPTLLGNIALPPMTGSYIALQIGAQVVAILALWVASLVVVNADKARITNAIWGWLINWALFIGVAIALGILLPLAAAMHETVRTAMMLGGIGVLTLTLVVLIPMKIYRIEAPRAIGLLFLSAGINLLIFASAGGIFLLVVGRQKVTAPMQAAVEQFHQVERAVMRVPPPPPPDYTREINGLLEAALHPANPRPSLADREAQARLLQQKLQNQRNNLTPSDRRARLVYQNQFNRYMLFLNAVVAERKAQSPREAASGRPPASALTTPPH